MAVRRVAVLVVAALVASLGVLVGSEAVVPPPPAAALPPAGVSTLAGTGAAGQVDGPGLTARFDLLDDLAVSPDGAFVYVLEHGASGRPNAIRKIDTANGEVSTFTTGGLLAKDARRIEVDPQGNVWVSINNGTNDHHLVRYDSSGVGTSMVTSITGVLSYEVTGISFVFDASGEHVYFVDIPTNSTLGRQLIKLPIPSSPTTGDAGTPLGGGGDSGRRGANDMAFSAQGDLYILWGDSVGNAPGLWRFDGPSSYTKIGDWTSHQYRIGFAGRGGSLYNIISSPTLTNGVLRKGDFGLGPVSVVAGGPAGTSNIDGDPGKFSGPSSLAFSPDGKGGYILDRGNRKVRQLLVPPDPWELSPDQLCGACNRGQRQLEVPKVADPVDIATGNLTESFTDLALPGRGPAVAASRTYNSHFFAKPGLFGPGWSSPLDMKLEKASNTIWIFQENGASLPFARLQNGAITSAPRVTSTLQELPGIGWRLDRNHGDIVTFGTDGKVTGWEDRNGYVTTVTRPSSSQIVMTTPGGRSLTFTVSSGHVTSVTDDSTPARTVTYGYTGGRLSSVESFELNATDPAPITWGYGYDPAGRLNTITNPRGRSNLTHYDAEGRVEYQDDFAGARTEIAYGGTYPEEWRTVTGPAYDASGTRPVVRYQLDGLLTASTTTGHGTASARTVAYTYDPETLGVATVTGPGAVTLAAHDYDANGNMLTSTDVTGRTSTYGYTDPDNPTSPTTVTDPDGNVALLTYDDDGNIETSSVPVRLPSGTLQGTAVTTYLRDDPAHPEDVTGVIAPGQQGQPTPKASELSYRAGDGQLSWVEDPEDGRTTFGYDSRGFVTSTVTPRGNATPTAGDYETTFTVNDFGMVQSVTDPLGEVSSQLYDGNGNATSVTDANAQTTTTTYDAMDRPRVVTRADASQTETTYFPNGAVREQINGLADATAYAYTVHGEVLSITDPNGHATGYRYDALGRLAERIEPGGTCPSDGCTTYGYNADSELTTIGYSDPATPDVTAIAYDDLGRRSSVTRSAGAAQTWTWDSLGQLRSSTDVNGRTTAYDWTLNGNLASITYPGQQAPVGYTYDAADRMETVTDWAGRVTGFGWTDDSQWETTTFPSGTTNVDTRTYDEAGRLGSVEWEQGSTSLGQLTYARDGEGLLESETPTGGTFSTRTWGYDEIDQLDQVDADPLGLDDAGNLTLTEDGTHQVFDPAQQLCWTSPTASGACATPGADATVYDHDDRGNRTAMDEPGLPSWGYGYDQEDRMTSATQGGPAPISGMTGIPVSGDYDGDDHDDVFWYHAFTGRDWMSWGTDRADFGTDVTEYEVTNTAYEPFSGDFDGDGNDDIFWFAPGLDGDFVWFWFNDANGDYVDKVFPVDGEYRPAVGDFDGDGFSDIYWYGPGTDDDTIWWGDGDVDDTGGEFTDMIVTQGGSYQPVAGDLDGDGHDDIVWYQPGLGADEVWYGSSTRNSWTVQSQTLDGTDWELTVGDFDGDDHEDLFLYSGAGSQVWWGTSTRGDFGPTLRTWVTIGSGYDLEAGDFDGDGNDDVLLYDSDGPDDAWWGTATRSALGAAPDVGLAPSTTATYAYDSGGLRNAKTVDGTTTQFTWDTASGLPLLLSQHQGSSATQVVYGPGGTPLYEVTGTTATYYHQDHQGSTRLTTDATGAPDARYGYDAYGALETNTAPTSATPLLGYTGQYTDEESGFIYLRARYLDPATGQFTTRDPLAALTQSPYAYAEGDPVNRHDPSGLVAPAIAVGGAAIGGTAALIAVAVIAGIIFQGLIAAGLMWVGSKVIDEVTGWFSEEPESGDFMGDCIDDIEEKIDIAAGISAGHSWTDHGAGELDIAGPGEWSDIVQDTILDPDDHKTSGHADGREAYWNDAEGLLVIVDPQHPDGGTAYRPDDGRDEFDDWQ